MGIFTYEIVSLDILFKKKLRDCWKFRMKFELFPRGADAISVVAAEAMNPLKLFWQGH
jgi:hypothetical protein